MFLFGRLLAHYADHSGRSGLLGLPVANLVGMERSPRHRSARNRGPLASQGLSALLASYFEARTYSQTTSAPLRFRPRCVSPFVDSQMRTAGPPERSGLNSRSLGSPSASPPSLELSRSEMRPFPTTRLHYFSSETMTQFSQLGSLSRLRILELSLGGRPFGAHGRMGSPRDGSGVYAENYSITRSF